MAKKTKVSNLSIEERLEQALIPNWDEPYKLPENWCWVRVDAIASIYTGNSINERVKDEKYIGQSEGLIYLATKDIGFDSIIDYETNVRIPSADGFKVAPKFSTLLCIEGGSAGRKIGFITQDVCFVNKLCAFVPHSKINPKYLYYAIQSDAFKKQFDAKKHGLIGGVSVKEVSSIFIPFAPIEIQNKIVELIESVFNKLDEAKEKSQEVVDGFETRKAAILHKAFSGELTAKWREENSCSLDDWADTTIGAESILITKGASPRWQGISYVEDKSQTLFITSENVREGYLDLSKEKYLENKINEIQKRSILKKGDVLVNIVGASIGRAAIFDLDCLSNINQAVCLIRVNSKMRNEFLCYFLNSPYAISYYNENKVDVARANVSLSNINKMPIILPALDEQDKIIEFLNQLLFKEMRAKEAAESVIEQIDTMKKAILARAFRGELGTNDPSEESAVELLKQII